jgi:DtxR family Mn-dependent transcriptional regulator
MEDYLEVIHCLENEQGYVRVKDIAGKMEITMPSVSGAVKNLEKQGLVAHPRYDLVGLTPKGTKIAKDIYHRHQVIKDFLYNVLGLDKEIAEKDACRIEHNISPETLNRLIKFLDESEKLR